MNRPGPHPDRRVVTEAELQQLRRAIADPGTVTARGRTPAGLPEVPAHWAARAVIALGWRPPKDGRP